MPRHLAVTRLLLFGVKLHELQAPLGGKIQIVLIGNLGRKVGAITFLDATL